MLNNFLKKFNLDKSDFYFIIILFICLYLYFKSNNKENFAITTVTPEVKDAISALYQADVEAIRNLSSLASNLTLSGSLSVPGGLNLLGNTTISGQINANNNFKVDLNGNINTTGNINSNSNISSTGGNIVLSAKNPIIDLGAGDTTREGNAGKITYGIHDNNALCFVGKGVPGSARQITMWDNVTIAGALYVGGRNILAELDQAVKNNDDIKISSRATRSRYLGIGGNNDAAFNWNNNGTDWQQGLVIYKK